MLDAMVMAPKKTSEVVLPFVSTVPLQHAVLPYDFKSSARLLKHIHSNAIAS